MRLLNVIRSVNLVHGGPAEGLRQSVCATAGSAHTQEVLSLDGPQDTCIRDYPVTMHALGPVASNYGYSRQLVPWLKVHAHEYDAVIVHGMWQFHGLAVWRALRGTRTPYFVYFHGMLDPWFKTRYPLKHLKKWLYWPWADYRVARDAAAVLFTASEEARLASKSFWLYRVRPAVVGYGIALDANARIDRRELFHRAFPETRGKRIVLFLGRIHPKKGCDLLIDAFGRVAAKHEQLHLVMAGPDQVGLQPALETLARTHGVAHRISFTGMLQGDLKWAALQCAEVFALPSHQENFGIAVVEALAMGVPVLISQRVNIWREIVGDGAGFAEADTAVGTADMLRRWLALSRPSRAAMNDSARASFAKRFHVDAAAARLIATIESRVTQGSASAFTGGGPVADSRC